MRVMWAVSSVVLSLLATPAMADSTGIAEACGGEIQRDEFAKLPRAVAREKLTCFTREAAKQFNKTLPSQVDAVTILQSVSASGVMLTYHYTVSLARQDVPAGAVDKLKAMVTDKVCKAADMSMIVSLGGAYAYEWKDKDGELIGAHVVDRCN